MKILSRFYLVVLFAIVGLHGFCQSASPLQGLIGAVDSAHTRLPIEKLFLQTDKPYYTIGDTLHFKAYLLNADYLSPSLRSGLLYVELDDVDNKMVKRMMFPLTLGLSWGDMAFEDGGIPEGSYTLRAYTNWMLNFGEDYIFTQSLYLSPVNAGGTLINANFKLDKQTGQDRIMANLLFNGFDKQPVRLMDLQLKVKDGKRTLYKDKATTDLDGFINVNFKLPARTNMKHLAIEAQDAKTPEAASKFIVPVTINRAENTDLQFMPEGGALVAGIPTRVAFKAISENGTGVDLGGQILDSKMQRVATFQSLHAGMGSFELMPQAAEVYTAKVNLPGNISKTYPLPAVNAAGTSLRVDDKGGDSLKVVISGAAAGGMYLLAQARGVVCYAAMVHFTENNTIEQSIAKAVLPTGITRFTLLNAASQPLNERIVYIDHHDNLSIAIAPDKPAYKTRDSISLAIQVTDKQGKPVQGSFSLAVTDDSQVKPDSTASNIENSLLFTSDLKGMIEQPGYYLQENNPQVAAARDNLLLTRGWVGYSWKQIFDPKPKPAPHPAEKEFAVKGRVVNIFNKPVAKSRVVLLSTRPLLVKDTVTNKDGEFVFKDLFMVDTAVFKIQARTKLGNSFNVDIAIDEMVSPVYAAATRRQMPWYVNSDTTLLNNTRTKIAQQKAGSAYRGEGHMLNEVVIKAQKIIKGSKNLNGPGEADQSLDEKELEKAGKMTLGELLEKRIKGFKVTGLWSPCLRCRSVFTSYLIGDALVHLVFDGVDANKLFDGYDLGPVADPERTRFLKGSYLDYYTAEDITGIEVMYSPQHAAAYKQSGSLSELNIAFIEITTRGGKGPFMKYTPGTYLYKPLAFTLPKKFYRPRYTVNNNSMALGTDLRSTIHWEPNIITDSLGRARVSFYSADKPASYSIMVQGTDLFGQIGAGSKKVLVK
jgi:hypothetical protein